MPTPNAPFKIAEGRPALVNVPVSKFGFGSGVTPHDLSEISRRLADYLHTLGDEIIPPEDGSLWPTYAQRHRDHVELFKLGRPEHLREVCSHLFATHLTHGFAQSALHFTLLRDRADDRVHVAALIIDKLHRLAEALGAMDVMSPEHGRYERDAAEPEEIIPRLESALDCDLTPPAVDGALYGLRTSKGIFNERHFDSIYVAARLRRLGVRSVVEIGGGAGYVAYYAHRMGIPAYSIIDLPSVAMVQYIILAGSLGERQVGLRAPAPIRLVPSSRLDDIDWSADCLLNVDSLPEMPPHVGKAYIDRMRGQKGFFLSINQESGAANGKERQLVVRRLCAEGFRAESRHPYWMRTGWVEEIFRPRG